VIKEIRERFIFDDSVYEFMGILDPSTAQRWEFQSMDFSDTYYSNLRSKKWIKIKKHLALKL